MTKIITISGQKGGTGKSVTAVNAATSFSLLEKKTLLIDFDPHGSATKWCDDKKNNFKVDIASALSGKARFTDTIAKTRFPYLDVIPAGYNLFPVASKLAKNSENEKILRLFLGDVRDQYEYIIIDSSSSYHFLSIAAMAAADWILICTSIRHNTEKDFHSLLKAVQYIRRTHHIPIKIAGLLFNRCKAKKDIDSFLEDQNLLDLKQMVYKTIIPEDDNINKSIKLQIPLVLHDIKSPAADAYLNFAQEIHSFFKTRGV